MVFGIAIPTCQCIYWKCFYTLIYGVVIGIPVGNEPSWSSWSRNCSSGDNDFILYTSFLCRMGGGWEWERRGEEEEDRRQVGGVSSIVEGIHERGGGSYRGSTHGWPAGGEMSQEMEMGDLTVEEQEGNWRRGRKEKRRVCVQEWTGGVSDKSGTQWQEVTMGSRRQRRVSISTGRQSETDYSD